MLRISHATIEDIETILMYDMHISRQELKNSIALDRVLIARMDGCFAGWMRYNMFWDNTPFMNMLYVLSDYQGKGIGSNICKVWEQDMKHRGYRFVMTSTQSNEYAQHFYNKIGYSAVGGFILPDDAYEIIMCKTL